LKPHFVRLFWQEDLFCLSYLLSTVADQQQGSNVTRKAARTAY